MSFHSQVTIKCNTKFFDSQTWELMHYIIVIESGEEEDTIIALALSLLSVSLFTVIHVLTLIGFYMERRRSGI